MMLRFFPLLLVVLFAIFHATTGTDEGDWIGPWLGNSETRTTNGKFLTDPHRRTYFRGGSSSGTIEIGAGQMCMTGTPRYYISNYHHGWKNIEMTGTAHMVDYGASCSVLEKHGFSMGARSSHDNYTEDGCHAQGYYAEISLADGTCAFHKEFFHDPNNGYSIYADPIEKECFNGTAPNTGIPGTWPDWSTSGVPINAKVGMKFTITTDGVNVYLKLYINYNTGGNWVLVHEFVDSNGAWPAANDVSPAFPYPDNNYQNINNFLTNIANCPFDGDDPVTRAGNSCFWRGEGCSDTKVCWEDGYILNEHSVCSDGGAVCHTNTDCCTEECVGAGTYYAGHCTSNPDTDYYHSTSGGDPHFTRWQHSRDTFHGECDLVMIQAPEFDLHARTTIDSYFSYIESAALRVGKVVVEMEKDQFYVNGVKLSYKDDLPFESGGIKVSKIQAEENKQTYRVNFLGSSLDFKFYKKFLSIKVGADSSDFAEATGLLGKYPTGEMYNREGEKTDTSFEVHAFEWQVAPDDVKLFREDRAPQLPFETCRMPTAAQSSRRRLRSDTGLLKQAEEACSHVHGNDFQLCVDDVMMTGDIGLAEVW